MESLDEIIRTLEEVDFDSGRERNSSLPAGARGEGGREREGERGREREREGERGRESEREREREGES
jgi:hypothetical protein